MKLFINAFLFLLSTAAFAQSDIAFKSMDEKEYHVGDRISAGTLSTSPVLEKYRKYTVELNSNLAAIRQFTFDHPKYEYMMVVVWRQLGRKFPSQTEAATDTLEHYFRREWSSGDNRQYLNMVDHLYSKNVEQPYMYLEIISDNSPILAAGKKAIVVPEEPILYKRYTNTLKVDTSLIAADAPIFVELPGSYVQRKSRGTFLLKPRHKVAEKRIHVKSGITTQRVSHGVYWFKFRLLPTPEVFLNDVQIIDSTVSVREIRKGVFSSKYANQELTPNFIVAEVDYTVNGKKIRQTGDRVTKSVLKALEGFNDDDKVVIDRIIVHGPDNYKIRPGKA